MKGFRVEYLYEGHKYDLGFPPEKALDFLAWLNEQIERVPLELRESICIELDATSSYDDSSVATLDLWYLRRETAADLAEDEQKRREHLQRQYDDAARHTKNLKDALAKLTNNKEP